MGGVSMTASPHGDAVATWLGPKSGPSAPIRWANWLGRPLERFVNLDESYLVDRALRSHPDFPAERLEFRDGLRALTTSLEREARLNFLGRTVAQQLALRLIRSQIRILKELDRHPEVCDQEIRRPVFVVGLPRTGTTILLALLSQDPAHRPLLLWEGLDPVPPRRGPDRRLRRARSAIRGFDYFSPSYQSIHPMGADLPEECVLLFMPLFSTPQFDFQYQAPGYLNWLRERDLGDAYRRYRDQLRLLQWQGRSRSSSQYPVRWLLKDPAHLLGLEHILECFPDACVVQTHRDPLRSLPSNCSLYAHSRIMFSDEVDARELGAYVAGGIWPDALDVALEARKRLPEENFFDLRYADFMRDPIRSMEGIYRYFGLELSESTREAMRAYLDRPPRTGDRVHSYSLGQFGLSAADQRKRYEAYCARFDIPTES
jgi:hypothetical protein